MANRRLTVLGGVLLLVLGAAIYLQYGGSPSKRDLGIEPAPEAVTPKVELQGLTVERDSAGRWWATVPFQIANGAAGAVLNVEALAGQGQQPGTWRPGVPLLAGAPPARIEILRPESMPGAMSTDRVGVVSTFRGQILASKEIAHRIDWPDRSDWMQDRDMASRPPEDSLKLAVTLIDEREPAGLVRAKQLLERLVARDASMVPAYIELARVAMKTRWGPEGLQQAERLLETALKLQPDSVNAKVLLGYVYVNQDHLAKGEALYNEVAPLNPPNLWLWTNWGELHERKGQVTAAIKAYRQALSHPTTGDTYDYARMHAYRRLIPLLTQTRDLDGAEALYRQRSSEYPGKECTAIQHALFLLSHRGSSDTALRTLDAGRNEPCAGTEFKHARSVILYHRWAGLKGPEAASALAEARVAGAASPGVLLTLALSELTAPTIRRLVQEGERIDQMDNAGMTALAYAVQDRKPAAARRLAALGARPDVPLGPNQMPLAMWPVLERDLEGVKLMKSLGVDYRRLRWQGSTAVDHAKQTGDRQLLDLLQGVTESS